MSNIFPNKNNIGKSGIFYIFVNLFNVWILPSKY